MALTAAQQEGGVLPAKLTMLWAFGPVGSRLLKRSFLTLLLITRAYLLLVKGSSCCAYVDEEGSLLPLLSLINTFRPASRYAAYLVPRYGQ